MTRTRIRPKFAWKGLYIFAFLVLFYIAGFRYGLETDYWTYYHEFTGISTRKLEFSFNLFMQTVKTLVNNYNVFLMVFSAVTLGLKYRSFSKLKFCYSALLIYYVRFFVQFDLNAIRQGLAIAIVFFALENLKEENNKKFIVLILIAASVHNSALVLLILPIFKYLKLTMSRVLLSLVMAIVFRLVILDKVVISFARFLPLVFTSDISIIRSMQYILNNDTSNVFDLFPYIRIILPTICLFYLTRKTTNELFFKSYLIGAIINIAFFGLDTVSYRLAAYFLVAEILIIGEIYSTVIPVRYGKGKLNIKKISALFVVIFCDIWTFFALLRSSETLVPFKTFFNT